MNNNSFRNSNLSNRETKLLQHGASHNNRSINISQTPHELSDTIDQHPDILSKMQNGNFQSKPFTANFQKSTKRQEVFPEAANLNPGTQFKYSHSKIKYLDFDQVSHTQQFNNSQPKLIDNMLGQNQQSQQQHQQIPFDQNNPVAQQPSSLLDQLKKELESRPPSQRELYELIINEYPQCVTDNFVEGDFASVKQKIPHIGALTFKEVRRIMTVQRNKIKKRQNQETSSNADPTVSVKSKKYKKDPESVAELKELCRVEALQLYSNDLYRDDPKVVQITKDYYGLRDKDPDLLLNVTTLREIILVYKQESYINCFMGQHDVKQSPSRNIKDKDKLRIWLKLFYTLDENIFVQNLPAISVEIKKLLENCKTESILNLETYPAEHQINKLVGLLMTQDAFKNELELPEKFIALLISQHLIRTILRDVIIKQKSEQLWKSLNQLQFISTKTTVLLGHLLILSGFASHNTAALLIENYDNLLYDNLLHFLRGHPYQDSAYMLLSEISHTKTNPKKLIEQLFNETKNISFIWPAYKEKTKIAGLTLQKVQKLHEMFISNQQNVSQSLQFLRNSENLCEALDKYLVDQQARSNLDEDQVHEYQKIIEADISNRKIQAVYDQVLDISKQLAKDTTNASDKYKHDLLLVYFTALAVASDKRVVWSQLPPGSGKTWVNIMICIFLQKHKNIQPVYIVLNAGLEYQVSLKISPLKGKKIQVIMRSNVNNFIRSCDSSIKLGFIFDEFYDSIKNTKMTLDSANQIQADFYLGQSTILFISTGHFSEEFELFLSKLFDSVELEITYEKVFAEQKQECNLTNVKAYCNPDLKLLEQQLKMDIEENNEENPIIIFGMEKETAFQKGLKLQKHTQQFLISTPEHLQVTQKHIRGLKQGVIFLSDEFKIGIDLKMAKDALVYIYCPGLNIIKPDRESMLQMVGRGQRSKGTYAGTVYTSHSCGQEIAVMDSIKDQTIAKFFDAAANLRSINAVLTKHANKPVMMGSLVSNSAKNWINEHEEFLKHQKEEIKKLLQDAYKELKPLNGNYMK